MTIGLDIKVRIPAFLFQSVQVELERRVNSALDETAAEGQKFIAQTVSIPFPPPSAGGEPPHRRTGRLYRGIEATLNPKPFWRSIKTEAPYSIYLEFGTVRMAERPFMRPGARQVVKLAPGIFRKHLGGR
jgi:HK97 gp10 family phage protein